MSCAAEHRNVALACSAVAAILQQCPDEERLVLGLTLAAGCVVGAKLPDVLEPAIHSHHRAFFHSLVALGGIGWAIPKVLELPRDTPQKRLVRAGALGILLGYGSHLLLDSGTPRGIPLV